MRLGPSAQFFFYGTLLDADLRRYVIGRPLAAADLIPAAVAGFRRVRVQGQAYPMLVPGLGTDRVEGVLASGLDAREIARLIAYEGEGYGLVPVTAHLADGTRCTAQVFRPLAGAFKPSNEPWDLVRWQRDEKPRVLRQGIDS